MLSYYSRSSIPSPFIGETGKRDRTYFLPPLIPEFMPGECPFKIRGNQYIDSLKLVKSEADLSDLSPYLPNEAYRDYLSQKFDAWEWYDDLALSYLHYAHARHMKRDPYDAMQIVGRWHVQNAIRANNILFRMPKAFIPLIFRQMLVLWTNFGEAKELGSTARSFILRVQNLPRYDTAGWANICQASIAHTMASKFGYNESKVLCNYPERSGEFHGYPTYSLDFEVIW